MGDQSLARMIRRRRETLGFSQARLGELVGRSASTIRNWERGKSTPSAVVDAVALAAVLGLEERQVVEAAGFETKDLDSHQTMEQAYASLAPESPADHPPSSPPGDEPEEEAGEESRPDEEEEEPGIAPPARSDPGPDPSAEPVPRSPGGSKADPPLFPGPPGRRLQPIRDETEAEDDPEVVRAAPPTVLEAAPEDEPSYVEDPVERQRYRARALATAVVVVFLLIVLVWSFDRAVDAAGTMWEEFTGMLEF